MNTADYQMSVMMKVLAMSPAPSFRSPCAPTALAQTASLSQTVFKPLTADAHPLWRFELVGNKVIFSRNAGSSYEPTLMFICAQPQMGWSFTHSTFAKKITGTDNVTVGH